MAFLKRARPRSKTVSTRAERRAGIDDYVASRIQTNGPGLALAVIASGTIVHAAGYGLADLRRSRPIEPDTIFHLASSGKQFTGLGILMLAEESKLDLDDPIANHIPSVAGFGPGVTIRDLLHHTSGVRDLYDDDGVEQMLARCERPANADVIRTYADLGCPMGEAGIEPGDVFRYSNSGYELLGAVIEEVSGQTYHDFFAERVFDRLDMKDTFSIPDPRTGSPRCATGYTRDRNGGLTEACDSALDNLVGSGSFYTTVFDLCRYDHALRTNSLVSAASLLEAFTGGRTNDDRPTNYGFGWFLRCKDGISIADHEGDWNGFRSYICYCVDRPLSIFVLSNHPELDLLEIADAAMDATLSPIQPD
jgi:CubicO group peptidase (beta-lactamase class C family)